MDFSSQAEDEPNAYGIIAEFPGQAPLLMEAEGDVSSLESARDRAALSAGRLCGWCRPVTATNCCSRIW